MMLNDPWRKKKGSRYKFAVNIKQNGKIKELGFGDPNMEIRRDNPKRRASFRARHKCSTATDRTTKRFWSCKMWQKNKTVTQVLNQGRV